MMNVKFLNYPNIFILMIADILNNLSKGKLSWSICVIISEIETMDINNLLKENHKSKRISYILLKKLYCLHNTPRKEFLNFYLKEYTNYFYTINYCFLKAINDKSLNLLLACLFICSHIKLFAKDFLPLNQSANLNVLEKILFDFLSKGVKIKTGLKENVSYQDNSIYNKYEIGVATKNISDVNYLFKSMDYSRLYYMNSLISVCIHLLTEINISKTIELIINREPITNYMLIKGIPPKDRLRIGAHKDNNNPFLLYEIIRRSLMEPKNILSESQNFTNLKLSLHNLFIVDKKFFKYSIKDFLMNEVYAKAFGNFLGTVQISFYDEFVETILFKNFKTECDCKSIYHLFTSYVNTANQINSDLLGQKISKKWNVFLNKIIGEEEFIQEVMITNYYIFILNSHINKITSQKQLENLIKCELEIIKSFELKWFRNKTAKQISYFINLTKLYLYAEVWKKKNYGVFYTSELSNELISYLLDQRKWIWYYENNELPDVLKTILSNFRFLLPTIR